MLATEDNINIILMALQGEEDTIGVDTETSGLDVRNGRDYLTGICVATSGLHAYIPFRHPSGNLPMHYLGALQEIFNQKNLDWHNRIFDMHSLKTIGIDPLQFRGKQRCSQLTSHLWNEELYDRRLDSLCKKFLKIEKKDKDRFHDFGQTFGYAKIPVDIAGEYGGQDAVMTRQLNNFIWPKLQKEGTDRVYLETEMPFTRILYKLEQRGLGVDKEFTEEKARIGRTRMATLFRELGFNPASPTDLKKVLLGELNLPVLAHTDSCEACVKRKQPVSNHEGPPSFNKKVMEDYDDILQVMDNPIAKRIAEYRGWQKATTALYEPLLHRIGPDGLIRTGFRQDGTVTGRLSAAEPNLQQVPRSSDNVWNGDAKSAFTSGRKGFVLIGWDYSQLELRLAAAYGNERLLLDEFAKPDADPFNVLAPLIFGELTKKTRQDTKTFVYANLYGAGLPKIARQLNRPIDEVTELYERYKKSISGIMEVSEQVSNKVARTGHVKYWDGRIRHIRNKSDSYKAWNSVCQGGGAQLVKQAMLRCELFEDENCMMVLQVHDEITFIIREDMVHIYEPKIIEAMTNWPEFGVQFLVEGKVWE